MKPTEIIIELNKSCNLNCEFCYHKNMNNLILNYDKVIKIIDDIKQSKIKAVRFTGGEPLLRKDLIKILKYSKEKGLYTILNTNGTLITPENIHLFNYVDLVLISFHYLKNFKKIINALNILKNKNITIMIATILIKKNIKDLQIFYKNIFSITNKNFKEWILLRPIPGTKDELKFENVDELFSKIKKYNKIYHLNAKISNSIPFCSNEVYAKNLCRGGKFDCGRTRLMIDVYGNYKLDYSIDKIYGNVDSNSILDIWNLKELRNIRSDKLVENVCKKCEFLNKCRGGFLFKETLNKKLNDKK